MAVVQPADMAVKANEILARFRPIAPKPSSSLAAQAVVAEGVVGSTNRVLSQLQSRPCRARKRGRPSLMPPSPTTASAKRKKAVAPYPPLRCAAAPTDAVATATRAAHVSVVVPAASAAAFVPIAPGSGDMAAAKVVEEERDVPVERDLLQNLLQPKVISPRAVRPVGSTIRIESITRRTTDSAACPAAAAVSKKKTAGDVEAELEADALPAVVSDLGSRVRLVNEAYKEMVGQPECPWLRAVAAASRRISGEVVLAVAEHELAALPESGHGVPLACTAKIEWECDGKCTSVSVPCDVTRLQCASRDYLYIWRFRTSDADAPVSSRSGEMSDS